MAVKLALSRENLTTLSRQLHEIVSRIDTVLSRREKLRDSMIKKSRDVIRLSGWAINALHRGCIEEAEKHIREMEEAVKSFLEDARSDPTLYHTGLVDSTLAEYAEAKIFYSIIVEGRIPTPEELGVHEVAYLQGLGDVLGELRRLALDMLREDRVEEAELLLDLMEQAYYELRGLEYPDALIPGVKRRVDAARRMIDDTKTLLLEVKGRREVLRALGARPS